VKPQHFIFLGDVMSTLDSILKMPVDEIEDRPVEEYRRPHIPRPEWQHPTSEAERLVELENFLGVGFDTFREVRIEYRMLLDVPAYGRVDLLAAPKIDLDVVLAFEVKRQHFDVERALKQSADYVGGHILEGPHRGKRIAACFLYPTAGFAYSVSDRYHNGMFNLIAQWRVGRGFVDPYWHELVLAIGYEVIWHSKRRDWWKDGWTSKARDMLLGNRTVGGSRKAPPEGCVNG
jgi:hypothetical protein